MKKGEFDEKTILLTFEAILAAVVFISFFSIAQSAVGTTHPEIDAQITQTAISYGEHVVQQLRFVEDTSEIPSTRNGAELS